MTTLQAIQLLAAQIPYVYETLSEFLPGDFDSELDLNSEKFTVYVTYRDMGEGKIDDLRFTFLKKYPGGDWRKIGGIDAFEEEYFTDIFRKMMKAHYNALLKTAAVEECEDYSKYECVNYAGSMAGY